jgi:hypothetical protein
MYLDQRVGALIVGRLRIPGDVAANVGRAVVKDLVPQPAQNVRHRVGQREVEVFFI